MRLKRNTAFIAIVAILALTASAYAATPHVRVHAIFGGTGAHVGQVLDVRATGGKKATEVCWDPAPIDRPACSASENGAPSAIGTTKLTLTMPDGTKLTRAIEVRGGYTKVGGHGGSDAVQSTVTCAKVSLYGNTGYHGLHDKITTLKSGDGVALYNRVGTNAIFMWHYADNKAGFAKRSCAKPIASGG